MCWKKLPESSNLQRRFVENLAVHNNELLNEIYAAEQNILWSGSTYLSPVGVLNENLDNSSGQYFLPDFFTKTSPETHRG